jgi:phosphate-selective porin OprO/OprP
LEATYSDTYWDFTERSLGGINFVRPRDIGVMAYGIFAKDCIEYGIGVFNGRGPLIDNNNNKDLIGRVSFYPFFTTNNVLKELGLSVSGEIGRYTEDLTGTQFITGQRTAFWRWNDASVNHRRIEWGADLEWMHRAAAVRAEYLHVDWGSVKNGSISEPFRVKSGYVESSYILTGEEQPGNAVLIPNRDLDFKGGWGAWQLAVRYEMCHISHQPLQAKLATGANFSQGPTVALNWFFNAHIEMKMDWQYLHFNHKLPNSSGKNSESVIIARLQSQF